MLTERYAEEDKMSEIVESRTTTRQEPVFIADNLTISLKQYYIPAHYEDYLDHIMIPNGLILDRVEKLAYDILQDYKGKTIHLLCVLKGQYLFIACLITGFVMDYAFLSRWFPVFPRFDQRSS